MRKISTVTKFKQTKEAFENVPQNYVLTEIQFAEEIKMLINDLYNADVSVTASGVLAKFTNGTVFTITVKQSC